MVGSFHSTNLSFGTTTLTNAGGSDIFIAKYDISGNVLWAKSVDASLDDNGQAVTVDERGNIYIAGWFTSPVISFGMTTLNSMGGGDVFLAKLASGTVGLQEFIPESHISIAPNPITSKATITFGKEQQNTKLWLVDALGNQLNGVNFSGRQYIIEKGELNPGIYFLKAIDNNNEIVYSKIIIQ